MKKGLLIAIVTFGFGSTLFANQFYQCSFICGTTAGGLHTYTKCNLSDSSNQAIQATVAVAVAMGCGANSSQCFVSSVNSSCRQTQVRDNGGLCICAAN